MYEHSTRRAKGYAVWTEPGQRLIERDTLQCVHCGGHWLVEPGSGIKRGWCTLCSGPHCGGQGCWTCTPFERRLEQEERRAATWALARS